MYRASYNVDQLLNCNIVEDFALFTYKFQQDSITVRLYLHVDIVARIDL